MGWDACVSSSGLRFLCSLTTDQRELEEFTQALRKAERTAAAKEAGGSSGQGGGGYPQGEADDGARAPDVSPGVSGGVARGGSAGQRNAGNVTAVADGFRPNLQPSAQAPTFNEGSGGGDEWGESAGHELLP